MRGLPAVVMLMRNVSHIAEVVSHAARR
jgi:hypothetical protein